MKKLIATAIFLVLAAGVIILRPKKDLTAPVIPATETEPEIMVVIDYPDREDRAIGIPFTEAATVFSALTQASEQQQFSVATKQYDFGVFVQSIDGYESNADKAWIYYINGQSGNTAADQTAVSGGDTVEWRYQEPEL